MYLKPDEREFHSRRLFFVYFWTPLILHIPGKQKLDQVKENAVPLEVVQRIFVQPTVNRPFASRVCRVCVFMSLCMGGVFSYVVGAGCGVRSTGPWMVKVERAILLLPIRRKRFIMVSRKRGE